MASRGRCKIKGRSEIGDGKFFVELLLWYIFSSKNVKLIHYCFYDNKEE